MPGTPPQEQEWKFQDFYDEAKKTLEEYQVKYRKSSTDVSIIQKLILVNSALEALEIESKQTVPSRAEIVLILMSISRINSQITPKEHIRSDKLHLALQSLISKLTNKYIDATDAYDDLNKANLRRTGLEYKETKENEKTLEKLLTDRQNLKNQDPKYQQAMHSMLANRLNNHELIRAHSLNIVLDNLLTKKANKEGYLYTMEASLALELNASRTEEEVRSHIRSYLVLIDNNSPPQALPDSKPPLWNALVNYLQTLAQPQDAATFHVKKGLG